MRFLHLADLHLGRMLYGRSLIPDQSYFLENVLLPAVDAHRPDAVLIAGDVFDRPVASLEAIALFDRLLSALTERGAAVVAISGNHDGPERMAVGKPFLARHGIHIVTQLEEAFSPILLGGAEIFALPYFETAQMRAFLGDETLRGAGACMRAAVERMAARFTPGRTHILLAHCFAAGSTVSDSESGIFVGGAADVPTDVFDVFDYAALGHLHAPQRAGNRARYAGSPLKYSVDEEHQKKSLTLVSAENGEVSVELLPIRPLHDVKRVSGTLEALCAGPIDEDYAEIRLTDNAPVYMPAERLRPVFPNLLAVQNEWFTAREEHAARAGNASRETLLDGFFRDICGETLSPEEEALLGDVLKETEAGDI